MHDNKTPPLPVPKSAMDRFDARLSVFLRTYSEFLAVNRGCDLSERNKRKAAFEQQRRKLRQLYRTAINKTNQGD
jgi:hypothetical protein